MLTPNARARLKQGSGILLYNPDRQRSQWVTLSRLGMLENRFESETQVTVGEGEGSVFDLSQARVVPMAPRAITVASLKPLLKALDLSEKSQKAAVYVALQRQKRVVPSVLSETGLLGGTGGPELRAPASVPADVEFIAGTAQTSVMPRSSAIWRRSSPEAHPPPCWSPKCLKSASKPRLQPAMKRKTEGPPGSSSSLSNPRGSLHQGDHQGARKGE
jgi:hypothetical protein